MPRARSNVLPLHRPRKSWPKRQSWTRAEDYGVPRPRAARGWIAAMVALPLAAFTAVFMWEAPPPAAAVPAATMAVTGEAARPRGWDIDPAALDAAQPDPAAALAPTRAGFAPGRDRERARFSLCNSMGRAGGNCVIDGDTFWYAGEKIRVADINAPEVSSPRCPQEAALGARATDRFLALLNEGAFTLETIGRTATGTAARCVS